MTVGQFVSDLVGNPRDSFSRDGAHIYYKQVDVGIHAENLSEVGTFGGSHILPLLIRLQKQEIGPGD